MKKVVLVTLVAILTVVFLTSSNYCLYKKPILVACVSSASPGGYSPSGTMREVLRVDFINSNISDIRIDQLICRVKINGKYQADDRVGSYLLYSSTNLSTQLANCPEENRAGRITLRPGYIMPGGTSKTLLIKADLFLPALSTISFDIVSIKASYWLTGKGWRKLPVAGLPIIGNSLLF